MFMLTVNAFGIVEKKVAMFVLTVGPVMEDSLFTCIKESK